jgi:hypothetical protein
MLPTLPYAEFYITNVCNLACPQCNRFNHLDFKGRYDYNPEIYQAWSKKIDIAEFGILGGEPTLHPHLDDWIRGTRKCWPNARGILLSNGTHLSRCRDLGNLLAENNIELNISFHNQAMKPFILEEIYKTFGYCEIESRRPTTIFLRSHQGVLIELVNAANFHQNALVSGRFELYDSNPEDAHRVCHMKGCHHFIEGELYKCGVVKLAPLLFEQYGQPVPDLFKQYRPLQLTDTITQEDLDTLGKKSIPQCKFCPSNLEFNSNEARFKNKKLNVKILGA